jgi:hypothetical protein
MLARFTRWLLLEVLGFAACVGAILGAIKLVDIALNAL